MSKEQGREPINEQSKNKQLEQFTVNNDGEKLTTNQGIRVTDDEHSLKAGSRGPTLMEDFHFREKMTHFDHERIPERIVHARGFGAHGYFQVYEPMTPYTTANFLQDPSVQTPVFVRFSTVAGSSGSADTVRDVRGFATKFYTEEGNYDLVGNNMPVFFIQDAIKFPDFVHAVKPEPHNEIPQAASAHDTFWDFVINNTESSHMVMWAMSDRSLPRSFRMMEGFGVHTFRLVNEQGEAHFVKFHWKPVLGVHSLVWDETQKIAGKDPDFNRRDLWDSIEAGNFPEFEFGIQLLKEEDEFKFDFDVLDPTKLWPEELIPVNIIGKMTLNRNTDNFFAETEQVAFHVSQVIDALTAAGITPELISTKLGNLTSDGGSPLEVKHTLLTADSVLFDAVYVAGGQQSVNELLSEPKAADFIREAFQHYKAIAAFGEGVQLLAAAGVGTKAATAAAAASGAMHSVPGVIKAENGGAVRVQSAVHRCRGRASSLGETDINRAIVREQPALKEAGCFFMVQLD
jgi:putative intracellular protease/amidase